MPVSTATTSSTRTCWSVSPDDGGGEPTGAVVTDEQSSNRGPRPRPLTARGCRPPAGCPSPGTPVADGQSGQTVRRPSDRALLQLATPRPTARPRCRSARRSSARTEAIVPHVARQAHLLRLPRRPALLGEEGLRDRSGRTAPVPAILLSSASPSRRNSSLTAFALSTRCCSHIPGSPRSRFHGPSHRGGVANDTVGNYMPVVPRKSTPDLVWPPTGGPSGDAGTAKPHA